MAVRTKNCLLSVSAILIGGLLYILFRPHTYVANIFEQFSYIAEIRAWMRPVSCDFIRFYLGDFLWMFALCCGLYAIFLPDANGGMLCVVAAAACGIAWEALQWLTVATGTGDWVDVLMYVLACVAANIINRKGKIK